MAAEGPRSGETYNDWVRRMAAQERAAGTLGPATPLQPTTPREGGPLPGESYNDWVRRMAAQERSGTFGTTTRRRDTSITTYQPPVTTEPPFIAGPTVTLPPEVLARHKDVIRKQPRVENILFPSGAIAEGVQTPSGPMTVEEWQRRENIRRYARYTPKEREAALERAKEAARKAEEKRKELGIDILGEPPKSLTDAGRIFEEAVESPILKNLKDLENRMADALVAGGGWGGLTSEAALDRARMIIEGKVHAEGIPTDMLEEYNKFIKEVYEPWREGTYEPAAEAFGKELVAYYDLEGKYTPEKIEEVQRKIEEEIIPSQEKAGRAYQKWVQMMGFALPKPDETEKQTLGRMMGELKWYRGTIEERRGRAAMVRPEMMDIRYSKEADRTLTETKKELDRIAGTFEPLEAYYYQQYGKPLASELLAEAPGKLKPSPFELKPFQIPGGAKPFVELPSPPTTQVTKTLALGGAQVFGIGEEMMKLLQQFTGFGPAEREAYLSMKYRQPVTPISVWSHPTAAWAGPEIKIPSAVLAGISGYGLEMKVIMVGAKAVLGPPVKSMISAVKVPIESAKLEYIAYKLGWAKGATPEARVMGMLYESMAPTRGVARALEWGRKIPVIGRAFRWHPTVEMAQADIAKWKLAGQKFGETLGFKPLGIRMGKVEYLRLQELMRTMMEKPPILPYQLAPSKATLAYWQKALTTGEMKQFLKLDFMFPKYTARPAPEVLRILAGQKEIMLPYTTGKHVLFTPRIQQTLTKILGLKQVGYPFEMMETHAQLIARASLQTQMIFTQTQWAGIRALIPRLRSILNVPRAARLAGEVKKGKLLFTTTRPMSSIDVSWEIITRPGRYAPTFAAAERTAIPLKMIAKPTPETFKLLGLYKEIDKSFGKILQRAAGVGEFRQVSMSEWAKSFMRTFQARASPAQALEPVKVLEKQAQIKAFEFWARIGIPTPSVFEGIAPSLAKIVGGGVTAGLVVRETMKESEELERHFVSPEMRLGLKPLERAMVAPEYGVTPIVGPVQAASAAVQEKIKQTLKLEMKQIMMVGMAIEKVSPLAYPKPFIFPSGKEEEERPHYKPKITSAKTKAFERLWPVGRLERLFEGTPKVKDVFNERGLKKMFKAPKRAEKLPKIRIPDFEGLFGGKPRKRRR